MRRNPDLDAALAELDAVGIRAYDVVRGGKHLQLRWTVNGQLRLLTLPCSASDWRSERNTRSDLRKMLRQDGMLPQTNGNTSAPSRAPCWREQVEGLARRLRQIPVPNEKVAERDNIVAALRRLMNPDGPSAVATGEEVLAL
jgi:hypothetical protein